MAIIDINDMTGVGRLSLYVGETPLTQFVYQDGDVTIAERDSEASYSLADLKSLIEDVERWIMNVRDKLNPPFTGYEPFRIEFMRDGDEVTAEYKVNGTTLSEIAFAFNTGLMTLQPRPEYTFSWAAFLRWHQFFKDLLRDCA